ncbi:MAG: hypothetical protein SW833_09635 [Cyanobacteriota bacterium]|nr:hypothetical protein [Cyanobacteriota bacterium]
MNNAQSKCQKLEQLWLATLITDIKRKNSAALWKTIGIMSVFLATSMTPLYEKFAPTLLVRTAVTLYTIHQAKSDEQLLSNYITQKVKS